MADPTDRAQFGAITKHSHKELSFTRTTFFRQIISIMPSTAQRSPAAMVASTIRLKDASRHRHDKLGRLMFSRVAFPRERRFNTKAEGLRFVPRYLGGGQFQSGMTRHPRLWFADVYMNVKYGVKTRPC
jgi:hypothetical protein